MSSLLWVPVPAGRVQGGAPVLRIVVTPRLDAGLAESGMADWPAAVNAASGLEVRTRPAGSRTPDAQLVGATLRPLARSDVWERFFGAIDVRPFARPAGYVAPDVARTTVQAADVRATYLSAATAVGDPAVVRDGLQPWHRPETAPAASRNRGEPPCDPPDFHRAVALLREHPPVLLLLGLVIEIELTGLPQGAAIRDINVTWPGSPVPMEPRWTSYEFDGTHFLPASAGDIASGLVDLSVAERWRIVTFDVDGGVGKLRETARVVLGDGRPDERTQLPTLRSAGLMLTRVGRGAQLEARSGRGRDAPADPERALTAEDLVLGYRLDIRPQKSNIWFSLHRRDATYRVGDLPAVQVPDEEGHLKPHAVVKDEDGLHTDEVVARWDGWSLSVARLRFDGGPPRVPQRKQRCPMPYDFEASFTVRPASLPVLEFGRAYQVRARVADLAGGGLDRDDPAADQRATDVETYVRYEPVPPPQVAVPDGLLVPNPDPDGVPRFVVNPAVLGPGGSLERLVIRSSPVPGGFSTAEFDGDPAYPPNDSRMLVAPATTFAIAEQHGALRLADRIGWERVNRAFKNTRGAAPLAKVDPAAVLPDPAALGAAVALLPEAGTLDGEVDEARPWSGTWPDLVPKHVVVVAAPAGTAPRLRWVAVEGTPGVVDSPRVRVELAPGDHVVAELSSTIRGDNIDSFAINLMVGAPAPGAPAPTAAQNAVVAGRHPMLTPARRLELVHAVRRPMRVPGGSGTAERPAGATYARVLPTGDPLWNVHPPTTAQVEILAAWDEWTDAPEPTGAGAPVAPLPVARGAAALPEIQQEFGDTKHRVVDYTLTAVSRYGDCFAPTDDPGEFAAAGAPVRVSVPSSARPAPPVVAATVPAFAWSQTVAAGVLTRVRGGGRLRVELGRPWYTTGSGEALGVVVWPGSEADLPPALRSQVSWLNRDPIHLTSAPPALAAASMFAGSADPVDVHLPDVTPALRVLPYPVFSEDGRWYADLAMPGAAAASYCPFVHLALVRFQQESLVEVGQDLRASAVVRTDMVPVLPDRRLEVRPVGGSLLVTLSGLSRQDPQPNQVIASIERTDDVPAGAAPVELTSLTPVAPGFPVWTRVVGATTAGSTNQPLPPLAVPAGPGRLRLVVREVEPLAGPTSAVGVDAAAELTQRTVYVDMVDLPSA